MSIRRRAALHTLAAVIAVAFAYHVAATPMWWMLSVYAAAWIACGVLYLVALYLWETAADRIEARVRRNLYDERMQDELRRYRRRLYVVRAIHRSKNDGARND